MASCPKCEYRFSARDFYKSASFQICCPSCGITLRQHSYRYFPGMLISGILSLTIFYIVDHFAGFVVGMIAYILAGFVVYMVVLNLLSKFKVYGDREAT